MDKNNTCFIVVLNDGNTWSNLDGCKIVGMSIEDHLKLLKESKSVDGNYDNPARGFKDADIDVGSNVSITHLENCGYEKDPSQDEDCNDFDIVQKSTLVIDGAHIELTASCPECRGTGGRDEPCEDCNGKG